MKSKLLIFIILLVIESPLYSKTWRLTDINIDVVFDDQTTLVSVTDKRINKTWEQLPFKETLSVQETEQIGNSLKIKLSGKYEFEVEIILTPVSSVEILISGNEMMQMGELAFPSAFILPADHYILMTDGEGLLLPVNDTEYPVGNGYTYNCGGGLSMAWMGVVDQKLDAGFMAILETPYDAALQTKRVDDLVTFSPIWQPSMGKFGYTRKVTYHFFDKGGYVAQAKLYRDYVWKKNKVISLKEKMKRFPAMEKMLGGVHIYVWDKARKIEFAKELKSSGVEKALFLWDANHIPYPEPGFDNQLKELGYATGGYELFTDLKERDTAFYEYNFTGPMRFAHTVYPGKFN